AGEHVAACRRHAAYYLDLVEAAQPRLHESGQTIWLARLDAAHENLRTALAWARAERDEELGLRLAGALAPFWAARGYLHEGRAWLADLLSLGHRDARPASPAARAAALSAAG